MTKIVCLEQPYCRGVRVHFRCVAKRRFPTNGVNPRQESLPSRSSGEKVKP